MTVRVCAKAVSLGQRLNAATRATFAPETAPMARVVASASRVALRKEQIAHAKACNLC